MHCMLVFGANASLVDRLWMSLGLFAVLVAVSGEPAIRWSTGPRDGAPQGARNYARRLIKCLQHGEIITEVIKKSAVWVSPLQRPRYGVYR